MSTPHLAYGFTTDNCLPPPSIRVDVTYIPCEVATFNVVTLPVYHPVYNKNQPFTDSVYC